MERRRAPTAVLLKQYARRMYAAGVLRLITLANIRDEREACLHGAMHVLQALQGV